MLEIILACLFVAAIIGTIYSYWDLFVIQFMLMTIFSPTTFAGCLNLIIVAVMLRLLIR